VRSTTRPLSLRIVRSAGVVSAMEERCVLVSAPSRQLPSSPNSRRGARTRMVGNREMTIEWQRGPAGTWVTLVGDTDVMTVYWEADGTITMSPARGRARMLVTDGAGERTRRKTFRGFLHVAERALAVSHGDDLPRITPWQESSAPRADGRSRHNELVT
jgi:hypothetical protein